MPFCIERLYLGTFSFTGLKKAECKVEFSWFYVEIILTRWGVKTQPSDGVKGSTPNPLCPCCRTHEAWGNVPSVKVAIVRVS